MNPRLGNKFPNKIKQNYVNRVLVIGSVFRKGVLYTKPPKIKRFIIVGIDKNSKQLGVIHINSEINPTIFQTEELRKLHILFEAKNREYLEKDSYIDCAQLYEMDFQSLKNELLEDIQIHLGTLTKEDITELRNTLKIAKTIEKKLKVKYSLI
jgi:signal-transduction protein with cAMP-binding, CBS, and nucleotidyltransferase domain